MSLARILVAALGLCLALVDAALAQPQEEQAFLVMNQAEYIISRSVVPPGDNAPWMPVTLPDDWNRTHPGFSGSIWYRIRFDVANPRVMRTLYVPRITGRNTRWFVNGNSVGSSAASVDQRAADSYRPFQRGVPPSLQNAGENIVHVQVIGEAQYRHGLTTVTLGVGPPVVARSTLRQDLQVTASIMFGTTVLFAACVCLAIWLGSRKEPLLLWAALTGFTWSLWVLEFGWPVAVSLEQMQNLVLYLVRYLYVPPLLVLCLEAAGRRDRRVEIALWSALGAGALMAAALPQLRFPGVLTVASAIALVLEASFAIVLLRSQKTEGRWPQRLLALALLVLVALGAHDWGRWMGLVDYEDPLLALYATPFLIAALGGVVVSRYLHTLAALARANEVLESRVEEQVRQAQSAQQRVNEVLREQAVLRERQRIMSDMHDGIGADLIALLNVAQNAGPSSPDVARRITQLLVDLRIIVDSLEPVEGDLGVVLGNVRYRMRTAIEQSGTRFNWDVEPLPTLPHLTPEKVLSVQRIVMEALSNALQHSGAATVSLSARHDPQSAAIVITIEDDGRGFDASRVGPGRGLRTMRARGQQAGMQVSMTSSPGGGTRMELRVPVATP